MRLANRSLGGAVAVAAAVESGAAAAGEAAAAAVVAGAAGAGDVAPSAKRHTSSKHNTKPQPVHYETGRGSTLAVPTKRGAPVTIRLQCLARVNSRGVHPFAQRRHPACLERLRRRKPPICLSAWRTTDGTPSSRMIRSCDAQAPANLPNPTKRDAERAHKQLGRVSLALRCIGRKPKPRRPQRGCLIN